MVVVMPRFAFVLIAAALTIAGCNGSNPGAPSQQYNINQDINASFGSNIPDADNPGGGFQNPGADPYGYSEVWGR